MKKIAYLFLLATVFGFVSCDADFNPNDDWQERMVVYCLLDQDEDTTFVRVEKAFLGNGNALDMSKQKDSLYYGKDDLKVKMTAYKASDTNTAVAEFDFIYTTTDRTSANFYSGEDCPVYYCVTKGLLDVNNYYKLEITNLKTGKTAVGRTFLLGTHSIKTSSFVFYIKGATTDNLNNQMKAEWTNTDASNLRSEMIGKRYQLGVRFNYVKDGRIEHVDIPMVTRTNNYSTPATMTATLTLRDVLVGIENELKNETNLRWYLTAPFELWVHSGNLALYDYISINNTGTSLNYVPPYTNIEGGLGVFAARRTHISKSFSNDLTDSKLREAIFALGIFASGK